MGVILIVAFLTLGGTFAYSLSMLFRANELEGKSQQAMREASEFLSAILSMKTSFRDYLASGQPEALKAYQDDQLRVFHHLQNLSASVADPALQQPMEPEAALHITQMDDAFHTWKREVIDPFQPVKKPADPLTVYRFLNKSEDRIKQIRQLAQLFQNRQQNLNQKRSLRSQNAAKFALETAVLGTGLALMLVMLGFSLLSRSIVDPLLTLTGMGQSLAAGDYSRRVRVPGRSELGRLAASFNVMAENLETVRNEQTAIRSRLEALNRLASHLSRSLHARDRAEAVVMTLRREFGATAARVWLPEAERGWVCVESSDSSPVEYRLYSTLPGKYQSILNTRRPEYREIKELGEKEWTTPLLRSDRISGILQIRFPNDQWAIAEPLLGSFSRFSSHAFELARVYEEVSGERRRLDAILNSIREGVLVRDRAGKVALANPAVFRVLGLEPQPVHGMPISQLLEDEAYADLLRFIEAAPADTQAAEESGALPLGARFITATRAPLHDMEVIGVVVVLRDVTQQVEVDRMKSEFISIVSHELRTPLTSIKGSLGLLLGGASGQLSERAAHLLTIAQNNSDRLIRLINDILDISKIEAGRVQMAKDPVDLVEVVRTAAEHVEAMAHDATVRLAVETPEESPVTVIGDRDRLIQVVTNLLSNAIKFSPAQAQVEIQLGTLAQIAEVNVIDHGPGIAPEHQDKLFQKFYQIDSSSSRAKSGTGLGLAISQAIIKEHNGMMGVESAEGVGSRFWFTLPLLLPLGSDLEELPAEGYPLEGRPHVLICDDDRDITYLISLLLEQRGYDCERVHSGEAALQRLREKPFDLLTLDLAMPGMSGLEVARRLEEDPTTKDLPIVFVSAHMKSPEAKSLRISGWVTKPIDESRFQDAIHRALQIGEPNGEALRNGEKPLVLLVDDDPDVLQVVGEMVTHAGMSVSTAKGGEEALEKIRKAKPDAIVLDLMMPGLDGFDVMEALRQVERTRQIPVLVLTAKDLTHEERGRLDLGRTRFLTKSYASQQAILDDLSQLLDRELRDQLKELPSPDGG